MIGLLPDIGEESRLLVERVPFQSDKPNKVRPRDKKVEKKMEKMEKNTRAVASASHALDQVEENGDKRQRISNDGRFLIINVRGHVIKQPNPDHNEVASPTIPDDQSDIVELVDVQDGHGGGSCNSTSITERMAAEISWSQENRELCSACMEEFESATEVYIARLTKFTQARHGNEGDNLAGQVGSVC